MAARARRRRRRSLGRDYVLTNVNFLARRAARRSTTRSGTSSGPCSPTRSSAAAVASGDADAVDPVVTETFRYAPPVPHEGRIVTTDVEWHGRIVPAGSIVRVALASATNDETVFAEPRRFDPSRADVWPGDSRGGVRRNGAASHLAFGLGSHFCAGYKLSRLEAREGLVRLFGGRRAELAGPLPPLRLHQYHLTVPSLRVTLTQGGPA